MVGVEESPLRRAFSFCGWDRVSSRHTRDVIAVGRCRLRKRFAKAVCMRGNQVEDPSPNSDVSITETRQSA